MDGTIDPDDRITYAVAIEITGMSHGYLAKQARAGTLTRVGGPRLDPLSTRLSRTECEALALTRYRRGTLSDYWLTTTDAGGLLGITRGAVHKARLAERLRAQRAGNGDWLLRRSDVLALLMADDQLPGSSEV